MSQRITEKDCRRAAGHYAAMLAGYGILTVEDAETVTVGQPFGLVRYVYLCSHKQTSMGYAIREPRQDASLPGLGCRSGDGQMTWPLLHADILRAVRTVSDLLELTGRPYDYTAADAVRVSLGLTD